MYSSVMVHVHVAPHAQTHDVQQDREAGWVWGCYYNLRRACAARVTAKISGSRVYTRVVQSAIRYPSRLHKNTTYSASGIGPKK